ncbi:hypothetical protein AURDEDRAFT_145040 [Auricularia subglabra TFB-10046 SS5]|nr:hypothetical protein AURDEDRAFT_145040 [Auricularia subglabra TFB-10046 SS5]
MGLPVFILSPLFFFLRDTVIGAYLPRQHADGRWTDKVFESTLAGACIGFIVALLVSIVRTKLRNNDSDDGPTNLAAFATTGAQLAVGGQIVVNLLFGRCAARRREAVHRTGAPPVSRPMS